MGALIILFGFASVSAQDPPPHRLFGLPGDVTIDGEPLVGGDVIVVMAGERELGRTMVTVDGVWFIDIELSQIGSDDCHLTFIVNEIRAEQSWESCPTRVHLALVSGSDAAPDGMSDDSLEASEQSEEEADDLLEDEGASDDAGDVVEAEIVQPAAPSTGTGGLLGDDETANWPVAAALTAALMLVISGAALLISRRTDGAN